MQPSTEDLPFLLVHGNLVWPVVVALFAGALLGAVALVRWWVARRRVRAALDALRRLGTDLTVSGTLGGIGETPLVATLVASLKGGFSAGHTRRAPELWIQTSSGRIVLEGFVQIVAGDRAVVVF